MKKILTFIILLLFVVTTAYAFDVGDGDVNGDGRIDNKDLKAVLQKFGFSNVADFSFVLNKILNPPNTEEYFVAITGLDSNPGTINQPFRTIQKCAEIVVAGKSCVIRAGTYRETVVPSRSGTESAEIVYKPYTGETVIISGTEEVSGWTLESGKIYKATLDWDLGVGNNQVFIDGVMVPEARWPNPSNNLFDTSLLAKMDNAVATASGYIISDTALGANGSQWGGGYITQYGKGQWYASSAQVISGADNEVTIPSMTNTNDKPAADALYFLFGKKFALDMAGEWFLDPVSKTLSLWPPANDNPAQHKIEVKKRQYGFDLSGKSNITVLRINMFATAIKTDALSTNNVIDGISAKYVSHFINILSPWMMTSGIEINGVKNTLRNSEIAWSAGNGVTLSGSDQLITNNKIHDVDYAGSAYGAIGANRQGTGGEVSHNTLYNSGRAIMQHSYPEMKVLYNDMYNAGLINHDLGVVYTSRDGAGTEIAYNFVHDNKANRYGSGIYLDSGWTGNLTQNFLVHHNVVWNTSSAGIQVNRQAKNIQVYNNTVAFTINSIISNHNKDLGVENIKIYNNIGTTPVKILNIDWYDLQNNLFTADPKFVNAANHNFQLQSSSPAIDSGLVIGGITDGFVGTAPDKGAFEYGVTQFTVGANF